MIRGLHVSGLPMGMADKHIWRGYGTPAPKEGLLPQGNGKHWRYCLLWIPHREDLAWAEYVYSNSSRQLLERLGMTPPDCYWEGDCLSLLQVFNDEGVVRLMEHFSYIEPPF